MQGARLVVVDGGFDEQAIKELARSNREAAADAVIRRWREPLVRHAAWILKDWDEAVDATHEVFVKVLREPRFFDAPFQMKAWLYRVTNNLCFNLVRNRRRRSAILAREPLPRAIEADQAVRVLHTERQGRLRDALDRLSEDHRHILMLRYWGDLSYEEIGSTLGIKLGTVMSRLSRARARLAEQLDDAEREAC